MIKITTKGNIHLERNGRLVKQEDPYLNLLDSIVMLEEGFTLRDYFKMINNYPLLCNLFQFIKDYYQEHLKFKKKHPPEYKWLILEKQYLIEKEGKNHKINSALKLFGLDDDDGPFGIDFLFNEIIDYEIKLRTVKVFRKVETLLQPHINFLEFVKGVIWDISFYGTPEETKRRIFVDKLERSQSMVFDIKEKEDKRGN